MIFTSLCRIGAKRRPERYTPSEVADFVRRIDPSFDSLANRFLQEVKFIAVFLSLMISSELICLGNRW